MTLLIQAASIRHAHGGNQIFEDTSFEIREGLADQRDAVVALGGQALEFEFGDHVVKPLMQDGLARVAARTGCQVA